jgi:hypothetical protein
MREERKLPRIDARPNHVQPRARATQTGSAGHNGATANLKLTFQLDHSAGADQRHASLDN